jgi:hypothetical protein
MLASCADSVLEYGAKNASTATWRGMFADELRDRYLYCPSCAKANARLRRGWAGLALAGVLLLVLGVTTCSARADDPCAPYCPVDGEKCRPPTSEHHIHTVRVCACLQPKVARR